MATFYLDLTAGSDAADGTTFANRWKTFTSGATAARIAPGDTIRVMSSPAPTSLGQNATWTDGSATVTLTTAVTQTICDCETAFTASSNVTAITVTNNNKDGTKKADILVASGFTTGKAAFFATGTLDLSAYQQVSFWARQLTGTLATANNWSIKLCTDTAGATAVHTANIPAVGALNQWFRVTVDLATNLKSAIASIGVYLASDQGSQTFQFDNIIACKTSSAADSLTLSSLIGKNTGNEGWYPIQSIVGTTIKLQASVNDSLGNGAPTFQGYSGTTGAVTTYKRETIKVPTQAAATTTVVSSITDSGTAGSVITYSGGWNTTDMSTQTGDTYFDGVNGFGYGIDISSKSYITLDKLNLVNFNVGLHIGGTSDNITCTAKDISGNQLYGIHLDAGTGAGSNTFTVDNVNANGIGATAAGGNVAYLQGASSINDTFTIVNCNSSINIGFRTQFAAGFAVAPSITITNARRNYAINASFSTMINGNVTVTNPTLPAAAGTVPVNLNYFNNSNALQNNYFKFGSIDANTLGSAVFLGVGCDDNILDLTGATISNCNYGLDMIYPSTWYVRGGTITAANHGVRFGAGGNGQGTVHCYGTTFTSDITGQSSIDSGNNHARICVHKYGGTADDHRILCPDGTIRSETSVRHTASGIAWKFSPTSAKVVQNAPLYTSLGKFAVSANNLVTVKAWTRRDNTGLSVGIRIPRHQPVAGVGETNIDALCSAAIDTYQEVTLTFTPTEAGVVELQGIAYGGTTLNGYIDDLTISQV